MNFKVILVKPNMISAVGGKYFSVYQSRQKTWAQVKFFWTTSNVGFVNFVTFSKYLGDLDLHIFE